jgi:predicted hydrocarbon binding protein
MNRDFAAMQLDVGKDFGKDKLKSKLANRAIELAKEWDETYFGSTDEDIDTKKARCSEYIHEKLMAEKENSGFIGALIGSILFSLLVQLIVRWIMKKFFPDQ